MNISRRLRKVSRRFTLTVALFVFITIGAMAVALHQNSVIRFGGDVTAGELNNVIQDSPAVVEYLESEKDFEAHFVTIASLVKQDQQEATRRSILIVAIPVLLVSLALGLIITKHLLKPVKESYESQERFMQDAAHELRNPLAAMSLSIQNAEKEKSTNTKFLRTMKRQTKRLIKINEDLLYLERAGNRLEIQRIDISNLLEDVLEDLQPAISFKKHTLKKNIEGGISKEMDPKDFIKLSRNILENAIKYTPSGKSLTVELKNEGSKIQMKISDNGIGIPDEDLNRIGNRFFRSKNTLEIDGSGLGLAIVNKVLNLYGGKMQIQSELKKGTTVSVVF